MAGGIARGHVRLYRFASPGKEASEEELALVAAGAMRLPKKPLDLDQLWKMPKATVSGNAATQAILNERDEGR